MKTLLFLALCISTCAAPLPPFPTAIKRSAPLLSPKAASAPKSKAMMKFTPAAVPAGTPVIRVEFQIDQIFFDSLVDITSCYVFQPAGRGARVQISDDLTGWSGWVADWGPYVEDQVVRFDWYHSTDQRRAKLFFRRVLYTPGPDPVMGILKSSVARNGIVTINTNLPGTIRVGRGTLADLKRKKK